MPTDNPKISAYVPQFVYEAFKSFQEGRNLSMSQAATIIFAEYFGIDLSKENPQQTTGSLSSKVLVIEEKLQHFEELLHDLSHQVEIFKSINNLNGLLVSNDHEDTELVNHDNTTSDSLCLNFQGLGTESIAGSNKEEDKSNLQLELLSKLGQEDIIKLEPLNSGQLSKRFNKNESFVKTKKNYYKQRPDEFFALLKQSDPQGVGWQYSEEDKKYHPILENQEPETQSD